MSLVVMEGVLADFGAAIGIPDLRLDEDRRCNLMIDDVALSLELGMNDESLYIYSRLAPTPDGDDVDALYAALLRANYSFEGTRGSTLSIDPQTGAIVLMREERLEFLRLAKFESVVEEFVDVAERWMQRIESGEFEVGASPPEAESAPSTEGMMRV